jgi:hypothetical protein
MKKGLPPESLAVARGADAGPLEDGAGEGEGVSGPAIGGRLFFSSGLTAGLTQLAEKFLAGEDETLGGRFVFENVECFVDLVHFEGPDVRGNLVTGTKVQHG